MNTVNDDRLIEEMLGKNTLWIVSEPDQVESFLVHFGQRISLGCGLASHVVLARGPLFNAKQIDQLK